MNSPSTPLDTQHFKQALSRFPTGVTIITTHQLGEANPADWGASVCRADCQFVQQRLAHTTAYRLEFGFEIKDLAFFSKGFALCDQCFK